MENGSKIAASLPSAVVHRFGCGLASTAKPHSGHHKRGIRVPGTSRFLGNRYPVPWGDETQMGIKNEWLIPVISLIFHPQTSDEDK